MPVPPHSGRRTPTLAAAALGVACLLAPLGLSVKHASPTAAEGVAAFEVVYDVLQHPRCLNCHPAGDRPLQFEDARPHGMNVQRGDDDRGRPGMRCATCHGQGNPELEHLPPGLPPGEGGEWHLAPRSMVFEGLSQHELASMLLDPERSHMTPEELVEHVSHDTLVLWGWDPGPGREPVPVPHEQFAKAFATWVEAGAPVPAEPVRAEEDSQ